MSRKPDTHIPFWLWPNLLSLDAPLIALVWQDLLTRCYPVPLRPAGRIALALTVWAIYITDRLLDVRRPATSSEAPRHAFYRQHRRASLAALAVLAACDLVVTLFWLRPVVREHGLLVAPGILLYLVLFALPHRSKVVLKKLMAAAFFTTGVFLIELNGDTGILWPALAFFALCTANMLLLEKWEQGARSRAWIPLALFALICIAAGTHLKWFQAIAASATLLSLVSFFEDRLSPSAASVLADAALLTPLLFR